MSDVFNEGMSKLEGSSRTNYSDTRKCKINRQTSCAQ